MAHRVLTQSAFLKIARDCVPSNNSLFSEEEIEQQTQDSDTEPGNFWNQSKEEKETHWKIMFVEKLRDERSPGLNQRALFQIIDISMINHVLKHTNMYIDQLRVDNQYSSDREGKNIDRHKFIAYCVWSIWKSH